MSSSARLLLLILAALPLSGLSAADDRTAFTKAVASSRVYGFLEILRNSGLPEGMLNGADVTLLIPVDTAFYTLTPEKYQALLSPANQELAARYIKAHVVAGKLTVAELAAGTFKTMGGIEVKVTAKSAIGPAKINGCKFILADQVGAKGMFHLIDGFLSVP